MRKFLTGVLWAAPLYVWTVWARPCPGPDPAASAPPQASPARLVPSYGKLPLGFEPNDGQADGRVKFLSRGPRYMLFLTPDGAVLALEKASQRAKVEGQKFPVPKPESRTPNRAGRSRAVLRMKLLGANRAPQVAGADELPGKANYFIGSDPSRWHTNLPTYAKVRYGKVYPGVDLIFYGEQRQLEYDFVVAPGGDPRSVRLGVEGVETVRIDAQGDLVLGVGPGEVRFRKPVVYQVGEGLALPPEPRGRPYPEGTKHFLGGRYVILSQSKIQNLKSRMVEVGFEVARYDAKRPLVIDPVLLYSTYLGGSAADIATGVAVNQTTGEAYVTGSTLSTNFPTAAPLQSTDAGDADVFVTKLNPTGSALMYSTYLGGSGFDEGRGIAVDSAGNAYVTGNTSSSNFPTKGSSTTYGGKGDAFVAKLNSAGSALVYSTYLGGSGADFGLGIALDSSGEAYVTGSTQSTNFPVVPVASAFQPKNHGASDAFVAKVKADGSGLVYSTYLGGSGADSGQGIAVDSSGAAYVTGLTYSADFPTAPSGSALQAANGGGSDVFVAKLNSAGSGLVYSTYLGGSGSDRGFAIAVDALDSAYVTGDSDSINYPATVGALQPTNAGKADAFVAKLNPTGTAPLVYFTFLGGSDIEQGTGIAADSSGNVYVTGFTQSSNFPTLDPLQPTLGGGTCGAAPNTFPCPDAFVSKLNAQASALIYSTYLGGSDADFGQAIAIDSASNTYIVGSTASLNFPAVAGAFQAAFGGTPSDAFVAKVGPNDGSGVALSPQTVAFGNQGTGVATAPRVVTLTNVGSLPLNLNISGTAFTESNDFGFAPAPAGSTPDCRTSSPVAAGGTCAFYITFTPAALGAARGTLVIADDAAGSPQQVCLTGTGVTPAPAATLSVTSINFTPTTPQPFGVATSPQTVTLTNTGTAPLSITKLTITGDFTQTNDCSAAPATLKIGASCTFSIVFTPAGAGSAARTGSLVITDNATPATQTVALTGTAIAQFSLCPASGATATTCSARAGDSSKTITVGTTSQTFYVTAMALSSFTGSISLTCAAAGGASASCTFSPTSIKAGQTSTVTVSGLSATTPNPLALTVTGTSSTQSTTLSLAINLADFAVSAAPALALTSAGQKATYTVTVTPSNGFNQRVTLSCLNTAPNTLPPGVSCAFSSPSVTPSGSTSVTVTLTVNTQANSLSGPRSGQHPTLPVGTRPSGAPGLFWLLALAMLAAWLARRPSLTAQHGPRRLPLSRVALAVTIVFILVWAGCNDFGPGPIGTPTLPGTPPGTYGLSIQGTLTGSSSVVRTVLVNLSVSRTGS